MLKSKISLAALPLFNPFTWPFSYIVPSASRLITLTVLEDFTLLYRFFEKSFKFPNSFSKLMISYSFFLSCKSYSVPFHLTV